MHLSHDSYRTYEKFKCVMDKFVNSDEANVIGAAVSGGPDSMALLDMLCLYAESKSGVSLVVMHVNHNMRESASLEDMDFVGENAYKRKLRFLFRNANVISKIREEKRSPEEAARIFRYALLDEMGREAGCNFIATGHNMDDFAETVMMRVLNGSGLGGLSGIPVLRKPFIRPMLSIRRSEIMNYLKNRSINYVVDETNKDISIPRNRIREELLPKIEADYNPSVIEALVRLGCICSSANDFLEKSALRDFNYYSSDWIAAFEAEKVTCVHEALGSRRIMELLTGICPEPDFGTVAEVLKVCELRDSAGCEIKGGLRVERCADKVFIFKKSKLEKIEDLECPKNGRIGNASLSLSLSNSSYCSDESISKSGFQVCFDLDKIKDGLKMCTVSGKEEYMQVNSEAPSSAYEVMRNAGIPASMRPCVPVLKDSAGIVWVPGGRVSLHHKIGSETEKTVTASLESDIVKAIGFLK